MLEGENVIRAFLKLY